MSTLALRKIQIGKSDNDNENIVLYERDEPDGIMRLGMGTIESIVQDLVKFTATGIDIFNPKVMNDLVNTASGKEVVHASWVLSKILELLPNYAVPVGSIIYVTKNLIPSGFIKCNGSALSRTTYQKLYDYIGITYGAGDGSSTFTLPDLRGVFIRGLDESRGIDVGRLIGSLQSDAIPYHKHVVSWGENQANEFGVIGGNSRFGSGETDNDNGRMLTNDGNLYLGVNPNPTVNFSNESRPINVALIPCIRYL